MDRTRDSALEGARRAVEAALSDPRRRPHVIARHDPATGTITYLVRDPASTACAVIDSVLDFDLHTGRVTSDGAEIVLGMISSAGLDVQWLLETHAHADHISAAAWLQGRTGGDIAMGRAVDVVQAQAQALFNLEPARVATGFDRLFDDGETFPLGGLEVRVLHVPGHTPADVAYVIGDAIFVGDALLMPDSGTGRTDFPGGDAAELYRSIQRLLRLPPQARVFVCHDYRSAGRDAYAWETTVGAQVRENLHVRHSVSETEFVAFRQARDADLSAPRLMLAALQANVCGGRLPEPEANGISYLKIPIDASDGVATPRPTGRTPTPPRRTQTP